MKTMGLQHLYLVSPKILPEKKAFELAAGADDILQKAIVCESLQEALRGCHFAFATSARSREITLPGLTPASCAELIAEAPDSTEIALVFGREHAGLTNEELLQCHYQVTIPSNPEYSSLNLSQAVQIIAYELRQKILSPVVKVTPSKERAATLDEVEQFYTQLKNVLIGIDFLKPSNPRKLLQRLRRLFNRAKLEHMEVNILRGILTHIQAALRNKE